MAEFSPDNTNNDTMFQDAVDALRRGDKPRAKELLTLLLKADQNNATYWVWLSASVDNAKERIYCLQTALKLDPENGTAKRGLILLGALPPDESVQPFPMNRPRAWEEKLLLANEKPKERGLRVLMRSPLARLFAILVMGAGVVSLVVFGVIIPNRPVVVPTMTNTPGPSPTFSPTPTLFGATARPTRSFTGPTPLWMMLPATYTPTALYVNTPRSPLAIDQYRIARQAYEAGDWDAYIANMQLIIPMEPDAADIHYMIGEAYRFKGQSNNAMREYQKAIDLDSKFGPPYLGLARARLMQNPDFDIQFLLEKALDRDPNFGEVYLERARYFVYHNKPKDAIIDLGKAEQLMPGSPAVYVVYAQAYVELDDKKSALEAAEKAYSLDITDVSVYQILGELYIDTGQYARAAESLEVYVTYEDQDALAFAELGQSYYELKEYDAALLNLNTAMRLSPNGVRRFYLYRGLTNLELKNIDQAVSDLETALEDDESSYDVNLGLVRAYFIQEKFGSAYLRVDVLRTLAKTDEQKAVTLYWRGLVQEKRGEAKDALKTWRALLAMSPDVMTVEMRADADQHLRTMVTPTNTLKPGSPTPTRKFNTPTPSATPLGGIPTPTNTPNSVDS
ncbi:MAG: tetratricopeptide repeat protein [Chloroflexi bacterium]|nr:tetratricopeptide repeat protein [Chloroflexota bacterium]